MDKPDYGVDAPGVVRNLIVIGLIFLAVGLSSFYAHSSHQFRGFAWIGGVLLLEGILLILYSKIGKFRHRDRMLRLIQWRGDEHFLDVGTGRGLLLIGAAKRATSGRGIGIDIFSGKDLSSNTMANTMKNVELEGVKGQVEIHNVDARVMDDFPDASFDVILSNLCLHNISNVAGREKACEEIARVLKPGGTALISDFKSTARYARVFRSAGLTVQRSVPFVFDTFPPLRIVTAKKA